MKKLIYAFPGNEDFAQLLALRCHRDVCDLRVHHFPDGESLVTVDAPSPDADIVLVCTLDHPDTKLVPLLMAADTLREYSPRRIVLVAAYLSYMRQDDRFHPGEAVSARLFGAWLSAHFDAVVTVDPHLHRNATLADAQVKTGVAAHAASAIAVWLNRNVPRPLIVGPDEESHSLVSEVALKIKAPCSVARKTRHDDTHVSVVLPPHLDELLKTHTPVVIDDIVSSGHTAAECVRELVRLGAIAPLYVAIHGIFAPGAREIVLSSGASRIVTTNTIDTSEAYIDVTGSVAEAIDALPLLTQPPREVSGNLSLAARNTESSGDRIISR